MGKTNWKPLEYEYHGLTLIIQDLEDMLVFLEYQTDEPESFEEISQSLSRAQGHLKEAQAIIKDFWKNNGS